MTHWKRCVPKSNGFAITWSALSFYRGGWPPAQLQKSTRSTLADAEFRVFSQWGEDGIIEWLVTQVAVPNNRFIEFGVENFTEANCRFLMHNRNWKGLIFDGNENHMTGLRKDRLFWMYLTAQGAFIT